MPVQHQVMRLWIASVLTVGFLSPEAQALDFDWQGQFRAETNTIFGYSNAPDGVDEGYAVPRTADTPANFQNLFLSLKPRILVNDNVSIHGDLWFNAPDTGLFGSNAPSSPTYSNTATGNGLISARAFFTEVATDFGTFRIGRMPLQYGLGLVWNSDSDRRSRLPSFGDAMTLVTKLGAFKFSPIFVKYQQQQSPDAPGVTNPALNSGITDYALSLSYANEDEQLDVGLLFLRRLAGSNSGVVDPLSSGAPAGTAGYGYNIWDFYAKKKSGIFTIEAEVPIASGLVASKTFSTVAGAVKARADLSENWNLKVNAGTASGQASGTQDKFTAFSFHPDYRPGLLMFNYNYRNIANGSGSFYNNPVTNARFLSVSGQYASGKFSHELLGLFGMADQTATGTGIYFNSLTGNYQTDTSGAAQEKGLGFELDYSLGYDWDEFTRFGIDTGLYFPGAFYKFNATATPNDVKTVFGAQFGMTVKF